MPRVGTRRTPYVSLAVVQTLDAAAEPQLAVWWPTLAAGLALGSTGLTALQLSLLLSYGIGATIASAVGDRLGTRRTTLAGGALLCLAYPLVPLAGSAPVAAACLAVAGIGNGALSVCVGTVTAAFERGGRRHMLLYRALFSAMELGGALLAGLAVATGLRPGAHLLLFALVGAATVAPLVLWRLPDLRAQLHAFEAAADRRAARRASLPLAALACLASIPVGIAFNAAPSLLVGLGATGGWLAGALAGFTAAQATAQAALWVLGQRVTARATATAGGLLAALGALLLVLAAHRPGSWPLAVAAFAVVGCGVGGVVPFARSIAGQRHPRARAAAVGTVTAGMLAGVAAAPVLVWAVGLLLDQLLAPGLVALVACAGLGLSAPIAYRTAAMHPAP